MLDIYDNINKKHKGCFSMSKNNKYTGEFKVKVIGTMRNENLTYSETLNRFNIPSHSTILRWERI